MKFAFSVLCCFLTLFVRSQQSDEKEVGHTIDRLFSTLSFADTSSMQLDSLAILFTSDGKLVANFGQKPIAFSAAQYAESIRNNYRSGQLLSLKERELVRRIDVFGKIAHVLSSYELTMIGKGGTLVRRGLNSIQLLKQDENWLIYSLIWDRENEALKLPGKYLPGNR